MYIPEEEFELFELFEKECKIASKRWPDKIKNPKKVMNLGLRKLVKAYMSKKIHNETNTNINTEES